MSQKPRRESTRPEQAVPRGRAAGARRRARGAAVAARARPVRRARGACPAVALAPRRDARGARSGGTSPRRWTCARWRTSSSSARGARRSATRPAGSSPPRTSASCRSASTPTFPPTRRWHPVDDLPRDRVRPRRDRALGPRAAARQALVHQRRLRARPCDVHARRAARDLRRGARARGVGDEPQARAAATRRAHADG